MLDLGRQHASLWTDSSQCAPLQRTHSVQGSVKVGAPSHSLRSGTSGPGRVRNRPLDVVQRINLLDINRS